MYFKGNFVQNGKSQGSGVTFQFVSRTKGLLNNKKKRKQPLLFNNFFLLTSYNSKKIFIGTNYNGRQTMFNHVLYRSPGLAIVPKNNFSISGKLSQTPALKAKLFMARRTVKHYNKMVFKLSIEPDDKVMPWLDEALYNCLGMWQLLTVSCCHSHLPLPMN